MEETMHYLLMANHTMFHKALITNIKGSGLTSGQPKVLDYLLDHNGVMQKDIAKACHIEPASLTGILNGMEKKGFIQRQAKDGNRRSLYVSLTEEGMAQAKKLSLEFQKMEEIAMEHMPKEDRKKFMDMLLMIYENLKKYEVRNNE